MRTALILIVSLFVFGLTSVNTEAGIGRNGARVIRDVIGGIEDIHKENEKTKREKVKDAGKTRREEIKTEGRVITSGHRVEETRIRTDGRVAEVMIRADAQVAQAEIYTTGRRGGVARSRGHVVAPSPQVVYQAPAPLPAPTETEDERVKRELEEMTAKYQALLKKQREAEESKPSTNISAEQAKLKSVQEELAQLEIELVTLDTEEKILRKVEEIKAKKAEIRVLEKKLETPTSSGHWTENPPAPPATE